MSTTRIQHGFTLIELLVVITIILLLVGLLMVALSGVHQNAYRTTCLGNLHQLSVAWMAYVTDNNGRLPGATPGGGGWIDAVTAAPPSISGRLYPYLNDLKVYLCPADNRAGRMVSYAMSCRLDALNMDYTDISAPSASILFIEEGDTAIGELFFNHCFDASSTIPGVWHKTGSCLSFVDGHAEYWVWQSPRLLSTRDRNRLVNAP